MTVTCKSCNHQTAKQPVVCPHCRAKWAPTTDEIAARAATIRATWSEDVEHARRTGSHEPLGVPRVKCVTDGMVRRRTNHE